MHKRTKLSGFTIVEVLIVVVVIAILAAISIVAYTNFQNRAYDSTVQSDLRQTFMKIQQFNIENGRLPYSFDDINQSFVTTRSAYGGGDDGRMLLYCQADDNLYAIIGKSKSGNSFAYSTTRGAIQFSSWPGTGHSYLCPAAGIPTDSSGYFIRWIGINDGWNSNYTVGQ